MRTMRRSVRGGDHDHRSRHALGTEVPLDELGDLPAPLADERHDRDLARRCHGRSSRAATICPRPSRRRSPTAGPCRTGSGRRAPALPAGAARPPGPDAAGGAVARPPTLRSAQGGDHRRWAGPDPSTTRPRSPSPTTMERGRPTGVAGVPARSPVVSPRATHTALPSCNATTSACSGPSSVCSRRPSPTAAGTPLILIDMPTTWSTWPYGLGRATVRAWGAHVVEHGGHGAPSSLSPTMTARTRWRACESCASIVVEPTSTSAPPGSTAGSATTVTCTSASGRPGLRWWSRRTGPGDATRGASSRREPAPGRWRHGPDRQRAAILARRAARAARTRTGAASSRAQRNAARTRTVPHRLIDPGRVLPAPARRSDVAPHLVRPTLRLAVRRRSPPHRRRSAPGPARRLHRRSAGTESRSRCAYRGRGGLV